VPGGKWILPAAALAAALAMAATAAHAEDEASKPDFPTTVFADGARSASVTVGDVTATVRLLRGTTPNPDQDKVWLRVKVKGVPVAEAYGPDAGFDVPEAEASIAEIDPGNKYPEVYFDAYTGGAHCCTKVVVAEEQPHGWVTVDVGEFDGGGDYLQDIDHDGLAEIATVDNRFLYTFDCYACSAAPLVIYTVRNGAVVDVSRDPRYLPAHRDWLAQLEDSVEPSERWTSQGFLAGWVATKVRLGEGADAWAALKAHWDYAHDQGEETCLTGADLDACPKGETKVLKFPDRLKLFLDRNGYGL
jgi:hypothetical protein